MIIEKLQLENFGLFSGKQELNLLPSNGKKIILIGGKNGNGKTTLFEAIRLCLYGQRSIENRFSRKAYEKYLIDKIHHSNKQNEHTAYASVGLEFQHAHLGTVDTYHVRRCWENNGKGLRESFQVKRNNKALDEVDADQWQGFINDIIPPGLSQLFFFDGEKIQMLADDMNDNQQLAYSFKALFGIDLVEKLQSDLEIYALKQLKKEGVKGLQEKIESLQDEVKKITEYYECAMQDKAQIQGKVDKLLADIERQEDIISKEGGGFAKKRTLLKERRKAVDVEIASIEDQLRDYCADILPFVFAQKLSKHLKKTLLKEEAVRSEKITKKNVQKKLKSLRTQIADPKLWEDTAMKGAQISKVTKNIVQRIEDMFSSHEPDFQPVHKLSPDDHNRILSLIDRASNEAPKRLTALNTKLEKLYRERHSIERDLAFAPPDAVIGEDIRRINELHHNLGALRQQLKSKEVEIKGFTFQQDKLSRELRKLQEELQTKDLLSARLERVKKVQAVLKDYNKKLEQQKIEQFCSTFITVYNQMARKKYIIERIEVNPKDYAVSLYKKGNRKIPKSQLSAGEKQIYAIAVLWALTKISGRPLPFIIDTPLGRLDSDHRNTLVNNFLPQSSHQLIVLSTDTEVDKQYFKKLKPETARMFHLAYNEGETKITEGYFWK